MLRLKIASVYFGLKVCHRGNTSQDNLIKKVHLVAEATVKALQAQNVTLLDHLENLENRSHRSNLRILNMPEGSEEGQDSTTFISELLKETMGE